MKSIYKEKIIEFFKSIDVTIGHDKENDIQVIDEQMYQDIFQSGSVGFGESYMRGYWDCEDLSNLFNRLLRADIESKIQVDFKAVLGVLSANITGHWGDRKDPNLCITDRLSESISHAKAVYGESLATAGARWETRKVSLKRAHELNYKIMCSKLGLKDGMSLLELDCQWGSFIDYVAKNYNVTLTGICKTKEQFNYLSDKYKNRENVTFKKCTLNDIQEQFDRIVCNESLYTVSPSKYKRFFKILESTLNKNGILYMQSVVGNLSRYTSDPWFAKYVQKNSVIPSLAQILISSENLFIFESCTNYCTDYRKTLDQWEKNLIKALNNNKLIQSDTKETRAWLYYLNACQGMFMARDAQYVHIMFSRLSDKTMQPEI